MEAVENRQLMKQLENNYRYVTYHPTFKTTDVIFKDPKHQSEYEYVTGSISGAEHVTSKKERVYE